MASADERSKMTSLGKAIAGNPLPAVVNEVGERIGLNYNVNRKQATQNYVEEIQLLTRSDMSNLKNTFYSLSERRTKKSNAKPDRDPQIFDKVRNPLKLNSKVRKLLYKLDGEEKKKLQYSLFEKVHQLWLGYASEVISDKDSINLFRLDLHGCELKCTASKNPFLVGSEGIVVQETKNTFQLITKTNRLLTVPKGKSTFEFKVHDKAFRIHGCNLLFTSQTRSKMKYKQFKRWEEI